MSAVASPARRAAALTLLFLLRASGQFPAEWIDRPVLPEQARRSEMYAYVNASIPPLPHFNNREDWTRHRGPLREKLLRLIGIDDILKTHSLRVIRRGSLPFEGYTIEKIAYESYPGMYVPALVWVPDTLTAKAPAMVSITGHTYCDSKAADYLQARNYNLVKRGFIVVSYDYLGCFERGPRDACLPGVWGGLDHTNSLFSYTRRTQTGIEVLDGIRALDYLYSRPDVDRTRVGFTGESGGGNSTYWVAALDDRVTLAVSVSAAGTFEQWIKDDQNYDWHQRPPGLRAFADIGTFYALIAPRPLLIVNGRPELGEFTLVDATRSVDYARHVYRLYGATDRIQFIESETGHGYQTDKRLMLYGWLDRWFFAGKIPLGERDLACRPEPKERFKVGLPEGSETIATLARRWIEETPEDTALPADPRDFQRRRRQALETLLARKDPTRPPGAICQVSDRRRSDPYAIDRVRLEIDGDLQIPGIFFRKLGKARYKTVLVVDKRNGLSPPIRDLIERGYALYLLDPRGAGEMDWGGGRTANWASFVGRSPIGMWAEDISKAVTYLKGRADVESVAVLGYGLLGKAALCAAALDERIAAAAVTTDTLSYRAEATSGLSHVYADVPGILTWGDTAQIAALVAPRPLAVLGAGLPVSANDEKPTYFSPIPNLRPFLPQVSSDALESHYTWTRRFYGLLKAAENFVAGAGSSQIDAAAAEWLVRRF